MNRILLRIVALLLVPCVTGESLGPLAPSAFFQVEAVNVSSLWVHPTEKHKSAEVYASVPEFLKISEAEAIPILRGRLTEVLGTKAVRALPDYVMQELLTLPVDPIDVWNFFESLRALPAVQKIRWSLTPGIVNRLTAVLDSMHPIFDIGDEPTEASPAPSAAMHPAGLGISVGRRLVSDPRARVAAFLNLVDDENPHAALAREILRANVKGKFIQLVPNRPALAIFFMEAGAAEIMAHELPKETPPWIIILEDFLHAVSVATNRIALTHSTDDRRLHKLPLLEQKAFLVTQGAQHLWDDLLSTPGQDKGHFADFVCVSATLFQKEDPRTLDLDLRDITALAHPGSRILLMETRAEVLRQVLPRQFEIEAVIPQVDQTEMVLLHVGRPVPQNAQTTPENRGFGLRFFYRIHETWERVHNLHGARVSNYISILHMDPFAHHLTGLLSELLAMAADPFDIRGVRNLLALVLDRDRPQALARFAERFIGVPGFAHTIEQIAVNPGSGAAGEPAAMAKLLDEDAGMGRLSPRRFSLQVHGVRPGSPVNRQEDIAEFDLVLAIQPPADQTEEDFVVAEVKDDMLDPGDERQLSNWFRSKSEMFADRVDRLLHVIQYYDHYKSQDTGLPDLRRTRFLVFAIHDFAGGDVRRRAEIEARLHKDVIEGLQSHIQGHGLNIELRVVWFNRPDPVPTTEWMRWSEWLKDQGIDLSGSTVRQAAVAQETAARDHWKELRDKMLKIFMQKVRPNRQQVELLRLFIDFMLERQGIDQARGTLEGLLRFPGPQAVLDTLMLFKTENPLTPKAFRDRGAEVLDALEATISRHMEQRFGVTLRQAMERSS
jgi:hypothetical protein